MKIKLKGRTNPSSPAPGWRFRINDHFDVACNISVHITITSLSRILPATTNVDQVKLARRAATLSHVQSDHNLEVR